MKAIINSLFLTAAVGFSGYFLGCSETKPKTASQKVPHSSGLPKASNEQAIAGRQIVKTVCASCHLQGLAGAPKIGNQEDWSKRVEQGVTILTQRAINGYEGLNGTVMPPRGGEPTLSDEDIQQAVQYLIEIHSKK